MIIFKWGQFVHVKATLSRNREDGKRYVGKRFWERTELEKPQIGVFLKKVTLWDGYAFFDPDDGQGFEFVDHHVGAYVVLEGRTFVTKVFYKDLEVVG